MKKDNNKPCFIHGVIRCFSLIREIKIINLGFNDWNGFYFSLLSIEIQGEKRGFEGELFGIHLTDTYKFINILFLQFELRFPISKNHGVR